VRKRFIVESYHLGFGWRDFNCYVPVGSFRDTALENDVSGLLTMDILATMTDLCNTIDFSGSRYAYINGVHCVMSQKKTHNYFECNIWYSKSKSKLRTETGIFNLKALNEGGKWKYTIGNHQW
jgi:hypothetical protein